MWASTTPTIPPPGRLEVVRRSASVIIAAIAIGLIVWQVANVGLSLLWYRQRSLPEWQMFVVSVVVSLVPKVVLVFLAAGVSRGRVWCTAACMAVAFALALSFAFGVTIRAMRYPQLIAQRAWLSSVLCYVAGYAAIATFATRAWNAERQAAEFRPGSSTCLLRANVLLVVVWSIWLLGGLAMILPGAVMLSSGRRSDAELGPGLILFGVGLVAVSVWNFLIWRMVRRRGFERADLALWQVVAQTIAIIGLTGHLTAFEAGLGWVSIVHIPSIVVAWLTTELLCAIAVRAGSSDERTGGFEVIPTGEALPMAIPADLPLASRASEPSGLPSQHPPRRP